MVWQKQLKQLKKQIVSNTPQAERKNQEKPVIEEKVSFSKYCEDLKIKPLKQDSVLLAKPENKKLALNINSNFHFNNNEIELFDQDEYKSEFYRFGQRTLPKDLRNGKYAIEASLDLHSYTKFHALDLLERFIELNTGKCIKIIHGQGLNSEGNKPVLVGLIRKYLEHYPQTIGYSYGSPKQGGHGVTIVKLKM